MQPALIGIVILAAVISRPIEARLWRAGRISDRTTAILVVGRFPVVVCLFGLILGASLPILIGLTIMALLPAVVLYRPMLDMLRSQASDPQQST